MDLLSQRDIKDLLARHQTKPSKLMGQHFLVSQTALKEILEASEVGPEDTVLEVGPGIGNLTQALAKRAKKVVAIEKDPSMVEILKETLQGLDNVEVIQGDILKLSIFNNQLSKYKVVANIPYYLTSHLIRIFLEQEERPEMMVLMMQKEVAQRICAKPPRMTLLSVSVQYYATPQIISYVPRDQFWPRPDVDSAIIKIVPRNSALYSANFRDTFFKVIKAGFSHPRKQLVNNLATVKLPNGVTLDKKQAEEWLQKSGLSPNQRAQTLSLDDWMRLVNSFT